MTYRETSLSRGLLGKVAEPTGLEPATSDVTGPIPSHQAQPLTFAIKSLARRSATQNDTERRLYATRSDSPTGTVKSEIGKP